MCHIVLVHPQVKIGHGPAWGGLHCTLFQNCLNSRQVDLVNPSTSSFLVADLTFFNGFQEGPMGCNLLFKGRILPEHGNAQVHFGA